MSVTVPGKEISAPSSLIEQTEEFRKQILTVVPGIHCAIGYGLANSMLIEGDDGNILIDTLESRESAIELKKDFQLISSKPIVAIIYTHNHADHINGAEVFVQENLSNVKIYAHQKLLEILDKTMSYVQKITFERAARQFGTFLTEEIGHVNCAIGFKLNYNQKNSRAFLRPTDTFDTDQLKLNICGRELVLYYAPGETDDQIVVYMPKERVLFAADNIYRAFPNLYAIRGTTARDARQWVSSLDLMRNLRAEYLIPSHTRPIKGEKQIFELITIYRDTIQFVHDQTVRFLNQGLTPDEIIGNELIQLPQNLREHPYLQEFYGTVEWSIRAIFDRYMGWFSGKSSDMHPDPPLTRAKNLIDLGGGSDKVFEEVIKAFQQEKYQWVLELTEALTLHPGNVNLEEIKQIHSSALIQLASKEISANGRNWYLTKSYEIQNLIQIRPSQQQTVESILTSSLKNCFMLLSIHFNYQKALNIHHLILFHFIETNEKYSVEIRNGIVDVHDDWSDHLSSQNIQMIIEVQNELVWKQIIAKLITPMEALENQSIIVKDQNQQVDPEKILSFIEFLLMFAQ